MITACTVIGPILAGGTVCFTRHTCSIIVIFVVSLWANLQTDGQIGNVQMGRGARQTAVLAGAGTRFTRLMTGPADTSLVREASWWTPTYAGIVQSVMFTGNTLRRALSIASLLITLGVTVVQHHKLVVRIRHHILTLCRRNVVTVQRCYRLIDPTTGRTEQIRIVHKIVVQIRLIVSCTGTTK